MSESTTGLQRLADRLYDAADNLDVRAALSAADLIGAAVIMRMVDEKPAPVTDSEKLADQMVQDITGGKVAVKDRQVVRKALDDADGQTKSQDVSEAVWRRARHYTPGMGGAMKPTSDVG